MPTTKDVRPPNPRGDRRGPRSEAERPSLSGLWVILGLFIVVLVVQALFFAPQSTTISYSEFKDLLRSGRIAEVVVGPTQIRATAPSDGSEEPESFTVVRVDDPTLLDELERYQIRVTGEEESAFLPSLLVWVVPVLLVLLVFGLLVRQFGQTQGGVMAFAKSRARIYAEDDVKVSFADVAGVDEAEAELREVVDFLQHPSKYTSLGGHILQGVSCWLVRQAPERRCWLVPSLVRRTCRSSA